MDTFLSSFSGFSVNDIAWFKNPAGNILALVES